MKISSYNMAQSAKRTYARQETISFQAELMKAHTSNRDMIKNVDESENEKKANEEELIAKNELLESLMAYLDRRTFGYQELPYRCSVLNGDIETSEEAIVVSPQQYRRQIKLTSFMEIHETESLQFTSTGKLTTEDGQTYDFSYDLELNREFYEKNSIRIKGGMIDPLVLNLDNKGVSFNNKKIHMDLDLDGNIDTFHMLNKGNGFLVLDKNDNGKVDDGSELFGPSTNDGFRELKEYDLDNNHWIDENDVIFNNLKIWTFDDDGKETLINIKDSNIGAIYLGKANGSFDYKNKHDTIARVTGSSIYLKNDGTVNAIHEIQV